MDKQKLGQIGEAYAAQRLESDGYIIRDRNWRIIEGELDLVTERDQVLVFVEVKTRSSNEFGSPEESFTKKKQKRVIRAAMGYLEVHNLLDVDWRVDMIALECTADGEILRFDHYEDVVQGDPEDFL
jgi:putative endonuclease